MIIKLGKPRPKNRRGPAKGMRHKRKDIHQAAFLAAYIANGGRIQKAAKAVKLSTTCHYQWIKEDEIYQAKFKEAHLKAIQTMEDEATRRGVEGLTKAVWYKGEIVGYEKVYSDPLLMFKLKGELPNKYREHQDRKHLHLHKHDQKVVVYMPDNNRGDVTNQPAILPAPKYIEAEVIENGESNRESATSGTVNS